MRWLLVKDLQILRRSPLLVALLVAYPVLVALLIGFSLSGGPGQAAGRVRQRGARRASPSSPSAARRATRRSTRRGCSSAVDPIRVDTREEAIELVRVRRRARRADHPGRRGARSCARSLSLSGDGRAPAGRGDLQRRGPGQAALRRVDDRVAAGRGEPRAEPGDHRRSARDYLDILLKGGSFSILGRDVRRARPAGAARSILRDADRASCPRARRERARARARRAVRRPRRRQPRPVRPDPRVDRRAGAGQADGAQRLAHAARRVRRRGGGRRSRSCS